MREDPGSGLDVRVNPHSGVPLYVQIRDQIMTAIGSGLLPPGARLPAVRELALALTINPNTVSRAYQELERAGLIVSRQGRGTHVRADGGEGAPRIPMSQRRRRLEEAAGRFMAEARSLGFSTQEVIAVLEAYADEGAEAGEGRDDG